MYSFVCVLCVYLFVCLFVWCGLLMCLFQIASCEVCSAGLGAKRKAKPPSQKRDIPRSGPPDPPKKRLKTGRPRKDKLQEPFTDQSGINISTEDNFLKVTKDLAVSSAGHVLAGNEVLPSNPAHLQAAIINSTDLVSTLKNTNLDFTHQIYTTIDEESSNQVEFISQNYQLKWW